MVAILCSEPRTARDRDEGKTVALLNFLSVALFLTYNAERRLHVHHPRVLDKKMLSAILIIFHIIELCMRAMSGVRFRLFIYRRSELCYVCGSRSSPFHLYP